MIGPEYLIYPSIWFSQRIINSSLPIIYFFDYLNHKRGNSYSVNIKWDRYELSYLEKKSLSLNHPFIEDFLDFMFHREKFIRKEIDTLYKIYLTGIQTEESYFNESDIRRLISKIRRQKRRTKNYNFIINGYARHKKKSFPVLVGQLFISVERIDLIWYGDYKISTS